GAAEQRLMVAAGVEKAAVLLIGKEADRLVHQTARLAEPARIKVGLVQSQQAIGQEHIVLQVAVEVSVPILPGAQQASIARELAQEKLGVAPRHLEIVGSPQIA